MDLFVYQDIDNFQNGKPVTGYRTATWVERFNTPGEFKIEAPLSSGLRELLPISSIVGKVQSLELMIVENVEIEEAIDDEPQLVISGRTYVSLMDHRYSAFNTVNFFGANWEAIQTYFASTIIGSSDIYNRLVLLIRSCIAASLDAGNDINSLTIKSSIPPYFDGTPYTFWGPDNLLKIVVDQLATWDVGIRTVRRNSFPGTVTSISGQQTDMDLYASQDRSSIVKFTPQTGDIEAANYLFTNKNFKTSCMVKGKWVSVMRHGPETGFSRRVIMVDGTDIDDKYETQVQEPSVAWTDVVEKMLLRADAVLARSRQIQLVSANVSENNKYRYRIDYNIGDIVTLDATYGEAINMRVVEFAEVEDERGEIGYPTLSLYNV